MGDLSFNSLLILIFIDHSTIDFSLYYPSLFFRFFLSLSLSVSISPSIFLSFFLSLFLFLFSLSLSLFLSLSLSLFLSLSAFYSSVSCSSPILFPAISLLHDCCLAFVVIHSLLLPFK